MPKSDSQYLQEIHEFVVAMNKKMATKADIDNVNRNIHSVADGILSAVDRTTNEQYVSKKEFLRFANEVMEMFSDLGHTFK